MKKKFLLPIVFILLLTTGFLALYFHYRTAEVRRTSINLMPVTQKSYPVPSDQDRTLLPTTTFSLLGKQWEVQIAKDPESRALGLSHIPDIKPNEGMLFLFEPEEEVSFWMKDMLFPIDLYWIRDGQVIGVEKNMQPESATANERPRTYPSPGPVDAVLEVKTSQEEL